jgi:hypothetical protein
MISLIEKIGSTNKVHFMEYNQISYKILQAIA